MPSVRTDELGASFAPLNVTQLDLLGFWTFPVVWYSREHEVKMGEKTPFSWTP
jgi:hypothetical protein